MLLKTMTIAALDSTLPAAPTIPKMLGRVKQKYAMPTANANAPAKLTTTVWISTSTAPTNALTKNRRTKSNSIKKGLEYIARKIRESIATAHPAVIAASFRSILKAFTEAKKSKTRLI